MLKRTTFVATLLLASSSIALAQKGPEGPQGNPDAGRTNPPAATENAPGQRMQQEDAGTARAYAPGQMKEDGESAKSVSPGQTKDRIDKSDRRSEMRDRKKDRSADRVEKSERSERMDKRAERKDESNWDVEGKKRRSGDRAETREKSEKRKDVRLSKYSEMDRQRVRTYFRKHHADPVDVDFSLNIGVAVPRSISLYPVPQDIVYVVPAYEDYEYFYAEDRIVIVDPVTYEIVEVIIVA